LNARQKRLFEEALKKNPALKMPEPKLASEWSEADLALIKQGVGDKSGRPPSETGAAQADGADAGGEQVGTVVTYFEDKGFGFLRPDGGGRDVFFHISRLSQGQPTELVPGARVAYELGMDRTGKMAAASVRVVPATPAAAPATTPPPQS
jgi:CspA family cold shock protein